MADLNILLYNKVELDDGSQGIVRYMGNIMGKKGVFYGIDITKGDAKNDGTFKKIKYFDTKKGTKTGRFCKLNKITKCKKTTFSKYPFQMGDVVMCTKTKCKGTVKYIGVPSWVKGGRVYYGLELTKKKGTCNGAMSGVQYFETKTNYGIYVPAKDVTKVKKKKKKNDDEKEKEEDVRDHMKDYYRSKSGNKLLPESIKTKKAKKGKKKAKKVKKTPPSEPSYLTTKKRADSLEALPPTPQPPQPLMPMMPDNPRPSIDYMDEEKDGINLTEYTAKTEQMDYDNQERQRRVQIDRLKQMEREDKAKREEEKKQKLKEQEERQRKQQELRDKKNEEKAKELSRTERQLKDKERLEKYRQAIEDRENADKEQQKQKDQLAETQKRNEMLKQQERQQKLAKEEAARKEMEEQRQLADKLRKEKDAKMKAQQAAKMKQEEDEKSQSAVSNGSGGGSIKDRMARFQKQTNSSPNTKPTTQAKFGTNKPQTQAKFTPKSNTSGVGAPVGADKAINFEMTEAFGKPLDKVKTTKVAGYSGEIPLVLYLLGEKLVRLDKFGTFKIFHPEYMEKEKNKPEMQIAHNIFTFCAVLPAPLLSTVPQSVLDKALNKDVMKDVVAAIREPYASTLCYLWDILAKVAMNPNARMGQQSLGKVFGPMCTMITQQDVKGNRVSMNALAASRMMAFFRRGVEWRMELQGFDFEDSDDSD